VTVVPTIPATRIAAQSPTAPSEPTIPATPSPTIAPTAVTDISEVTQGNASRPAVAFTFDAGAGAGPTPSLLQVLRDHNMRATFFLTGAWARQNPQLVRQIVQDGYELANHTQTHPDLTHLSDAQIEAEISRAEDIIDPLIGHTTKPWFRFPYGARDARVMKIVNRMGYRSIYWTIDSLDWMDEATVDSITGRVLKGAKNGSIILMHVGATHTAAALPGIIAALKQRGFAFETISEILR
jgi:peptidoglycan/xylan/chitin deacetylase (PgdA/CDA1 family)